MRGVDASGEYTLRYFIARSLSLGGLYLQQVPMAVVSEMVIGPESKSGILGGNILENFVVTVDYVRVQLILSSACEQSGKAIILPMRVRDHVLYRDVELDNHQVVSALIDTGSQYCLAPDCLLESIQKEKLGDERIRGPWMSLVQCEKVRLKNIKVGERNKLSVNYRFVLR